MQVADDAAPVCEGLGGAVLRNGLVALVLLHPGHRQRAQLQCVVEARHPAPSLVPGRLDIRAVVAHLLEHEEERIVEVLLHTDARELSLGGVALALHGQQLACAVLAPSDE
eukprot:1327470-Prymnesium_polylepis.1